MEITSAAATAAAPASHTAVSTPCQGRGSGGEGVWIGSPSPGGSAGAAGWMGSASPSPAGSAGCVCTPPPSIGAGAVTVPWLTSTSVRGR